MRKSCKFFVLFLFTQFAYGTIIQQKDCSETDIRKTNTKIKASPELLKHFSTPRNQDSIGWCYAFTAADMMAAEVGVPVSAIHTSAIYNRSIFNTDQERVNKELERALVKSRYNEVYEGGWAQQAIDQVTKHGWVCSETGLPFDVEKPNLVDELIKSLEALKNKAKKDKLNQEMVCAEITNILGPYQIMNNQINEVAISLTSQNLNLTMEIFSKAACTKAIKTLPPMKIVTKEAPMKLDSLGRNQYFQALNTALNKGKPIAIDYNLDQITKQKGLHAGLITARRWKDGKCEYKIRNTWGESCALYSPSIDCNKSEGSFWVSDEMFFDSSVNIRYISN